jgi:arylsulfatase A
MKSDRSQKTQPNIILINCDDLGYGDLGCYGSKVNSTPHLDRLAREGIRFTDFYMASPVCSPSRAAMLTGCYPPRIGCGEFDGKLVLFPGQGVGLNPEELTIAKSLKQEGYATKLVGKWHCGDQKEFLPTNHGFDEYFGLPYSNDMGRQRSDNKGGKEHRKSFPPLPLLRNEEVVEQQPDLSSLTDKYLDESVRFIRENSQKPFFLYLAHMHVHLPLYVAERFLEKSKNGSYGAAVECIDWVTGAILETLQSLGLDENTLIIFTSDNGSRCRDEGGSNGPLRGTKATTWEGGLRVPCIMRWKGTIPSGSVCKGLASSLDFLPTIASFIQKGLPTNRRIDGVDISSLMLSSEKPSPRDCFFYYKGNDLEAVRNGKWKLHVKKKEGPIDELYDLETDPGETKNLYHLHPEVVKELSAKLDLCRPDIGDAHKGVVGLNNRPLGRVNNPKTLTTYDPNHPYFMAMYDLSDCG